MLVKATELDMPERDGYDCTQELGITKYDPPAPAHLGGGSGAGKRTRRKNPYFKEYGGLNNFKWYPDMFKPGDEVVFTEKVHGTNFRFGWVPNVPDTLWKKVLKFFGKLPEYEFAFGSNRVQLHNKAGKKKTNFYEQQGAGNVYKEMVEKYDLKERTQKYSGVIFYAEIYGSSIQKNYTYGCKEGERRMVGFDALMVEDYQYPDGGDPLPSGFLDFDVMEKVFASIGIPTAPTLYRGPYSPDHIKAITVGNSVLEPTQKEMEGGVLRSVKEEKSHAGRKVLKLISDAYALNKDNTDYH
jgi:RNA ligase (TIGR02306 family)